MPKDFLIKKKKFGIYYTPSEATEILCEWGIKSPNDNILEPSFGACGFLEASRDRLIKLNSPQPNLFNMLPNKNTAKFIRLSSMIVKLLYLLLIDPVTLGSLKN